MRDVLPVLQLREQHGLLVIIRAMIVHPGFCKFPARLGGDSA